MRFKLRQMEVFRAVMLTGSMNGAARLLYISQPAVSRFIAHTENTLGMRLFDRARGKLNPTSEAELLFKELDLLFQEAERIDEFARNLSSHPIGALRFCCSPSLALNLIPPVVTKFMSVFPQIHVKFHTALLSDIPDELLTRKVDMAVSVLPLDHPNLIAEPFALGQMVCIMPKNHPLEAYSAVSLEQVAAYPTIGYLSSIPFGQLISAAFAQVGLVWRPAVDILRAESALALVREGAGLSIVDEFSAGQLGWSGITVRPLSQKIPLTLSILHSRFDQPSRHVRTLKQMIIQHVRAQGYNIDDLSKYSCST